MAYWDFLAVIAENYTKFDERAKSVVMGAGKVLVKNGVSFIPTPEEVNAEKHFTVMQRNALAAPKEGSTFSK